MHLLVALDGSPASRAALEHALTLAAESDGQLLLAHAVDPDVYEATDGSGVSGADVEDQLLMEAVESAEAEGQTLLEDAADRVADTGITAETLLVYGSPVDTLATAADEHGVGGIVVGHRSLSDRHERLLGSVAKGLIERAPVPVTVVRDRTRQE